MITLYTSMDAAGYAVSLYAADYITSIDAAVYLRSTDAADYATPLKALKKEILILPITY